LLPFQPTLRCNTSNVVSNPNILDSLKPQQFETLFGELFSLLGYEIKSFDRQNDIGYDLIARKFDPLLGDQEFIIEEKRTP
jgi:HJR/Mrr/RecB family endonuclease